MPYTRLGGSLVHHEYYLYYKFKLTFFSSLIAVESTTLPIGAPSRSTTSLKSRPEPAQPSTTSPMAPALADLQTQLCDLQSLLASHVDKVCALEDVFAKHDATKREVNLLRQLIENSSRRDSLDLACEREEEEFGLLILDDGRGIRTIVPHGLESGRGR